MIDTLAEQIQWREADGHLRFCYKILKAPRPRNSREITKHRMALQSMIQQQETRAENPVTKLFPATITEQRFHTAPNA